MNEVYEPLTDAHEDERSGLAASAAAGHGESLTCEEHVEGLPVALAALVRGVEPSGVREFTRGLFGNVARLLNHVECVRIAVEKGSPLEGVSRVLDAVRKLAGHLVTNFETAELRVEGLSGPLAETLRMAGFALAHELGRVFGQELTGAAANHSDPRRTYLRACALLENCFQQLTVGLARSFDARMSPELLFENYRRRREESLTLLRELRALLDEVRRVEQEYAVLSALALLKRVRRFRYECLHYLMYLDWEEFERFADALEISHESEREMTALLHKLSCYLEALLKQVGLRAVLADAGSEAPPAPPEAGKPSRLGRKPSPDGPAR